MDIWNFAIQSLLKHYSSLTSSLEMLEALSDNADFKSQLQDVLRARKPSFFITPSIQTGFPPPHSQTDDVFTYDSLLPRKEFNAEGASTDDAFRAALLRDILRGQRRLDPTTEELRPESPRDVGTSLDFKSRLSQIIARGLPRTVSRCNDASLPTSDQIIDRTKVTFQKARIAASKMSLGLGSQEMTEIERALETAFAEFADEEEEDDGEFAGSQTKSPKAVQEIDGLGPDPCQNNAAVNSSADFEWTLRVQDSGDETCPLNLTEIVDLSVDVEIERPPRSGDFDRGNLVSHPHDDDNDSHEIGYLEVTPIPQNGSCERVTLIHADLEAHPKGSASIFNQYPNSPGVWQAECLRLAIEIRAMERLTVDLILMLDRYPKSDVLQMLRTGKTGPRLKKRPSQHQQEPWILDRGVADILLYLVCGLMLFLPIVCWLSPAM
jgi:hypothetical protein